MEKKMDDYLEGLAVEVIKQQGIQFNSLKEEKIYLKKTTQQILQQLQQSNTSLKEGLTLLVDKSHGYVADTCKKLLDNFDKPEKIISIVSAEVSQNPRAMEFFSEEVNRFYDCGDYHQEECVIAVLLNLFPLHPQSYACFATLLWRKDGIHVAQSFYEHIADAFNEPVLDYFAAHCLVNTDNKSRAHELLERAFTNANKCPEQYSDLLPLIQYLKKQDIY